MDRLSLVIFDVDGTLVDSQAHIVGAMSAATDALGIAAPSREAVLSIVGLSLPLAMARIFPEAGASLLDRLVASYKEAFAALRASDASPLYPGAAEALAVLRAQPETLLGIATGKSRRGLAHVLEEHGLEGHFLTRQTADDHPSKPHPSMIEAALAETGLEADAAVMIGDTSYDMEMARAAGVRGLGVAWGYHPADTLMPSGAEAVARDFDDLLGLLALAPEVQA